MWFSFAVLTSLLYAVYHICNQYSKLNADIFIIYRGFLTAIVATPLALVCFHVFPWQFYLIVAFQGITISYMDYKYFKAFHKFGAENVNAVRPLTVFIIFIFWLILKPNIIDSYLAAPVNSAVIMASLVGIIFAVMKYRSQHIGKRCLREIFPLLLLSSAIDVSNKLIMEYNDGYLLAVTFHRVAFTGWIIGSINLFTNYRKINLRELVSWRNVRKGSFLIFLILSMISVNFAMYYAANPAYTTAITYLSVIWIVIINKICLYLGKGKAYPHIALKWILLLLISAISLLLATH